MNFAYWIAQYCCIREDKMAEIFLHKTKTLLNRNKFSKDAIMK
jgi:cysteinyl-tRNA synthetase